MSMKFIPKSQAPKLKSVFQLEWLEKKKEQHNIHYSFLLIASWLKTKCWPFLLKIKTLEMVINGVEKIEGTSMCKQTVLYSFYCMSPFNDKTIKACERNDSSHSQTHVSNFIIFNKQQWTCWNRAEGFLLSNLNKFTIPHFMLFWNFERSDWSHHFRF